jgi:hypothetical protein
MSDTAIDLRHDSIAAPGVRAAANGFENTSSPTTSCLHWLSGVPSKLGL